MYVLFVFIRHSITVAFQSEIVTVKCEGQTSSEGSDQVSAVQNEDWLTRSSKTRRYSVFMECAWRGVFGDLLSWVIFLFTIAETMYVTTELVTVWSEMWQMLKSNELYVASSCVCVCVCACVCVCVWTVEWSWCWCYWCSQLMTLV